MKNPDIIHYTEWKNLDTQNRYRIEILPAFPEKGPAYAEAYTYKRFNARVLVNSGAVESGLNKLPLGIQEATSMKVVVNLLFMNPVMKANILKPYPEEEDYAHLAPDGDERFDLPAPFEITNLWKFYSDRGTGDTWYLEFTGVQRKTPGMKFNIKLGKSEPVELELLHLCRALMEGSTPERLRTIYFDFDSPLYAPDVTTQLRDLHYYEPTETPKQFSLVIRNSRMKFYMFRLNHLFTAKSIDLQIALHHFTRDQLSTAGITRKPHENMRAYKQSYTRSHVPGAVLTADEFWFPGYVTETKNGIEVIGTGLFHEPVEEGEESFDQYTNVYNMWKYLSEGFFSKLIYSASEVGGHIVCAFKFARIHEQARTRAEITPRQMAGRQIKFETAGNIVRGCEVNIENMHLRDDDESTWFEEVTSIDSEQKLQVKMFFHNLPTIPSEGSVLKIETAPDSVFPYQVWEDRGVPICSKLYYKETALPGTTAGVFPGEHFVKIHERVGFYLTHTETETDGLVEYGLDNYNITAWGYQQSDTERARVLEMAACLINIQRNAGMPVSVAKTGARLFTDPSMTLYDLTITNNDGYTVNDIGDRGSVTPVYSELAHLPSTAFLIKCTSDFGSSQSKVQMLAMKVDL